jgi:LemA protein
MLIVILIAVVVALIVFEIVSTIVIRNRMIGARNSCDQAWSGIDVQLKRRHDLVPNLVETVKGYASHEREVFERVSDARAEAMAARGVEQSARAEKQLGAALVDVRAVAENYPQLRATENFQQLSNSLVEIEGQIQIARTTYNSDVQGYNTKIQIFPNSIIAKWGGFRPREFFEIEAGAEREPVSVSFRSQ